jgi:hypothetical protein
MFVTFVVSIDVRLLLALTALVKLFASNLRPAGTLQRSLTTSVQRSAAIHLFQCCLSVRTPSKHLRRWTEPFFAPKPSFALSWFGVVDIVVSVHQQTFDQAKCVDEVTTAQITIVGNAMRFLLSHFFYVDAALVYVSRQF